MNADKQGKSNPWDAGRTRRASWDAMNADKQGKSNGLWIKLVAVLLTVIGFLCSHTLFGIENRQDRMESKLNDVDKKVGELAVSLKMAEGDRAKVSVNP